MLYKVVSCVAERACRGLQSISKVGTVLPYGWRKKERECDYEFPKQIKEPHRAGPQDVDWVTDWCGGSSSGHTEGTWDENCYRLDAAEVVDKEPSVCYSPESEAKGRKQTHSSNLTSSNLVFLLQQPLPGESDRVAGKVSLRSEPELG